MPRVTKSSDKQRHDPLHVQLKQDEQFDKFGKSALVGKRKKKAQTHEDNEDEDNEEVRLLQLMVERRWLTCQIGYLRSKIIKKNSGISQRPAAGTQA